MSTQWGLDIQVWQADLGLTKNTVAIHERLIHSKAIQLFNRYCFHCCFLFLLLSLVPPPPLSVLPKKSNKNAVKRSKLLNRKATDGVVVNEAFSDTASPADPLNSDARPQFILGRFLVGASSGTSSGISSLGIVIPIIDGTLPEFQYHSY
jgi:hypothetical protein